MQMASVAVNELLARLNPYRLDENSESSVVRTSFVGGTEFREREGAASGTFHTRIGLADTNPLLLMPELTEPEDAE